jgi:predicted glycoside hydrolase/deacetylase ChbG (UPF0249 family)/predicted RNA methylase
MTLTLLPNRNARPADSVEGGTHSLGAPEYRSCEETENGRQSPIADATDRQGLREAFDPATGRICVALSGLDGCGKTTLAGQLAEALRSVGIPVERSHRFRWYVNLFVMPWIIARHRRRGRGVYILDRCLYDNLAGLLARVPPFALFGRVLSTWLARIHPSLDVRLRLTASWEHTAERRPGTTRAEYERFEAAYRAVTGAAGFADVSSDRVTLAVAIEHVKRALSARRMARQVILHADDLGLTYSFNEGIRRAARDGLLTSTSIRANGFAYRHAIDDVLPACPRLGVGLHLCLNEAGPVASRSRVPLLLDVHGNLRRGYVWLMHIAATSAGRTQIECELRAQIEKTLADRVPIAHLDSHQHVHMIPAIFRIVCRLACEYGIDCVRMACEPRHAAGTLQQRFAPFSNGNVFKYVLLNSFARRNRRTARAFGVRCPDSFIGVMHTGCMTVGSVRAGLQAVPARRDRVVEVLFHPTVGPDARDSAYPAQYLRAYVSAPQRGVELSALTAPELRHYLREHGWTPSDYPFALNARSARKVPARTPTIDPEVRTICLDTPADNPPWVSTAQADARAFAQIVLSQVQPGQRVLDLGTGSGILAICLAKRGIDAIATDICPQAVRTAQRNAARNGISIQAFTSDLLDSVQGSFDAIAFNLPYGFGRGTAVSSLLKNILRRVPFVCRNSGVIIPNGVLHFHQRLMRKLLAQAPTHLRRGGKLVLHVFDFEAGMVQRMLPESTSIEVLHHPEFRAHRTVAMLIRFYDCVRHRGACPRGTMIDG